MIFETEDNKIYVEREVLHMFAMHAMSILAATNQDTYWPPQNLSEVCFNYAQQMVRESFKRYGGDKMCEIDKGD